MPLVCEAGRSLTRHDSPLWTSPCPATPTHFLLVDMEDGELPARVLFCTAHMQQLETTGAVTGNIDDLVTAADVRQRTVDHFANIIRKAACRHDPREACDCTILPTAWTGDRIDSIDAKPETIAALLVDAMIERVTQHRP